jgi:hypothetical protein
MMFFSSNSSKTCRFILFFAAAAAAACNAVTAAAKESKVEFSDTHHRALRGNSPATTAATPIESLAKTHSRMLGVYTGLKADLAVQSGAGISFTHPPTTIKKGNVCADSSFSGLSGHDYVLDNGSASTGGCGPKYMIDLLTAAMAKLAKPIPGELGVPLPFNGGTYFAPSLTIADNTAVTLKGTADDIFLFLSGSYMTTGLKTKFILQNADGNVADEFGNIEGTEVPFNGPQAKNILFALTDAATTGAESSLPGSILAGAAVTLGAESDVGGYVLATAAMNAGEDCHVNSAEIGPDSASLSVSPITTLIASATCTDAMCPTRL